MLFYQTVFASVLFYPVVCREGSVTNKNSKWLNKLVKKPDCAGQGCGHVGNCGGEVYREEGAGCP